MIECIRETVLHELGHYFGLAHPHQFGDLRGGESVFELESRLAEHREVFGDEGVVDRLTGGAPAAEEPSTPGEIDTDSLLPPPSASGSENSPDAPLVPRAD